MPSQAVDPIPANYPRVSPYLIIDDAASAIDFITTVFGGKERFRLPAPNGKVGHAEIEIGDSLLMLADEAPEMGALSPRTVGGSPVTLCIYVEDADATIEAARQAGAKVLRPAEDRFYGDRGGEVEDPFGHLWNIASHIEDVPPEEMARRMASMGS